MARLRRDDELDSSLSEDTCPPIQLDIGHGDATPTRGRLNGIEETTGVRVEYDDMKKKNDLTTESLFLPSEGSLGDLPAKDGGNGGPLGKTNHGHVGSIRAITAARYTLLTFLPYQLYFQFSKIANLYFLITGIIQLIPGLSTTGTYTTILPLLFFLLFTVAREGYDDFRRYQLDKEENKRTSRVLRYTLPDFSVRLMRFWGRMKDKQERKSILESFSAYQRNPKPETSSGEQPQFSPWVEVKWIDIKVGDIIELSRDESVPADLILLYADGREGVAYVETMALDGETNLKTRHSIHQWSCESIDDISQARALFVVEDPSADLYEFSGKVSLDNTTFPLNLSNTLLRGCIVRNTNRVVGMVINTGEECKIRMNASKNPDAKAPAIQLTTNLVVILLAIFVVLLAVGCTVGYVIWKRTFEVKAWYLARAGVRLIDIFVAFAIMFNNLIPLALYVSLELIKFAQFLLLRDIEMYDEASNTPMVSNTQNIYENLGQINYILSDKTGTLTENVMKLRKMTIGGEIWLHDGLEGSREDTKEAVGAMRETPSIQVDGVGTPRITIEMPTITQDAADPTCARQGDPETYGNIMRYLESNPTTALAQRLSQFALCLAICHTAYPEAQDSGKTGFQAASPDELALVEASQDLGYLLIDRTTHSITLLTSSTRETYEVLHVIEFSSKRKHPSNETSIMERCLEHIEIFASDGLRTLVYGYRFLSQKEYDSWEALHHQATTSLLNRQNMIESAAEHVERDLQLAGATGIEDKLQVGVPETIEKFQQANIKIWMLTGDKRETAITIAHSAKICKSYSEVIILNGGDESEMAEQMLDTLLNLNAGRIAHSVIVIDGQALVEVEENETLNTRFYELLLKVDSVICCRASPSQKAAMVKRIRQLDSKAITLAIGDGGNDIAMIQEAHVGIGISGKEGLQAARVADYSIAQFRFLQRLLLVHGHWLYVRTAKFILLTFWKEMLFYVVQLLYQRWNGYTGTSLFESWSLAVWNTLFTALPVMIPGVFEQDLSAETLLNIPELYGYGQQSRGFNMRQYWWWMLMAVSEALVIYFMVYGLYGVEHRTGDQGLFALGDLAFSICVVFINVKLLILDYHHKTWIPIFAAILTISGCEEKMVA
ncbi:putative phospholipid-transporting ATPase IA [Amylocarpus encephaloides]|uniref:Phospholipid-transporting ATPase n=1 Tax=Amylocarpus encephaloides TaxID=45428 RepID=A0A9P7YFF0_9HELO|nr:putative phospholipid-transporting ATPase IA [Amylocarpus encephaloides]